MLRVGLTGGIGSGKTKVASIFKELGVPVYNADQKARDLMEGRKDLKEKLIKAFGDRAFVNGKLNRRFIADEVFSDGEQLDILNSIVHPGVREDYSKWCDAQNAVYVIEEAAILFESGAHTECDYVILVSAPEAVRIKRVIERDGMDRKEVMARIKSQWTDEQRRPLSDFIIDNDGNRILLPQVMAIHEELLAIST